MTAPSQSAEMTAPSAIPQRDIATGAAGPAIGVPDPDAPMAGNMDSRGGMMSAEEIIVTVTRRLATGFKVDVVHLSPGTVIEIGHDGSITEVAARAEQAKAYTTAMGANGRAPEMPSLQEAEVARMLAQAGKLEAETRILLADANLSANGPGSIRSRYAGPGATLSAEQVVVLASTLVCDLQSAIRETIPGLAQFRRADRSAHLLDLARMLGVEIPTVADASGRVWAAPFAPETRS